MYADTSNVPDSSTHLTSHPKVTIITAVYNAQKYLEECILSVINQTYTNFEYIIIDGGSTDSSVDIIKKYQDKISYWKSEADDGIYDAWNKGLAQAEGDWISFVGADDHLLPDAIDTYVNHIINHPSQHSLHFISSRIELVDEKLTPLSIVGEAWTWECFKSNMTTWHVGAFHSKRLFVEYGIFASSYKISGDYELLLRPRNHLITSFIDHLTVKMRIGGTSAKNLIRASEETYRAKIKNGVISPLKGTIMIYVDKLRLLVRSFVGGR
jgi:glycosyltransferase involved in cell wall biosynthesis